MSRHEILFQENLRVLSHSKSCAESFTEEEYQEHYNKLWRIRTIKLRYISPKTRQKYNKRKSEVFDYQ